MIVREVTAERVKAHFGSMVRGRVDRYEAANVRALNFVMQGALGGGGPRSLRADSLGKTLGGALVRLEIEVPDSMATRRRARPDVALGRRNPVSARSLIMGTSLARGDRRGSRLCRRDAWTTSVSLRRGG